VPPGECLVSGVYQLLSDGAVGPEHQDHPSNRSCSSAAAAAPPPGASPLSTVDEQMAQARGGGGSDGGGGSARQRGGCVLDGHVFDSSGLSLVSMSVQALGGEPPLTTRTASFEGVLDYLWLSRGLFELTGALEMPYEGAVAAAAASGGGSGGERRGSRSPKRQQQQQQQQQRAALAAGGGEAGAPAPPALPSSVPRDAFPPAPNAVWPSDHLAVGGELDFVWF
jgi:CCR4-NOT transcription complex subunit 6